jgi:hypothetical protein
MSRCGGSVLSLLFGRGAGREGVRWFVGTLPLTAYAILAGSVYWTHVVCDGGCVFMAD